jgi:hypothetical protein
MVNLIIRGGWNSSTKGDSSSVTNDPNKLNTYKFLLTIGVYSFLFCLWKYDESLVDEEIYNTRGETSEKALDIH